MSDYIYRLDKVKFYRFDWKDKEPVEDRFVLGYFSSLEELDKAAPICVENGVPFDDLEAMRFDFDYIKNRNYIYELSYEYAILNRKKQYVDYSYLFAPQNCISACKKLKKEVLKIDKYKPSPEKIFEDYMPGGFYIAKLKLNKLYGVISKKNQ